MTARSSGSTSTSPLSKSEARQRQVKAAFRTLIERTAWIAAIAGEFVTQTIAQGNDDLAALALEPRAYLPAMQKVVATARRRSSTARRSRPRIACSASSSGTRN